MTITDHSLGEFACPRRDIVIHKGSAVGPNRAVVARYDDILFREIVVHASRLRRDAEARTERLTGFDIEKLDGIRQERGEDNETIICRNCRGKHRALKKIGVPTGFQVAVS